MYNIYHMCVCFNFVFETEYFDLKYCKNETQLTVHTFGAYPHTNYHGSITMFNALLSVAS